MDPKPASAVSEDDRAHAMKAIEEALKSRYNARVGAVIARGKPILATGYKGEVDKLHAEQIALLKAETQGLDVKEATLYTTWSRARTHVPHESLAQRWSPRQGLPRFILVNM